MFVSPMFSLMEEAYVRMREYDSKRDSSRSPSRGHYRAKSQSKFPSGLQLRSRIQRLPTSDITTVEDLMIKKGTKNSRQMKIPGRENLLETNDKTKLHICQ